MNIRMIIPSLFLLGPGVIYAQNALVDTVPFALTLAYPISTANTADALVYSEIALIYSQVGKLSGAEFSGAVSMLSDDSKGFQVSGAVNLNNGSFKGFQATGLVNITNNFSGFQSSGVGNFVSGKCKGFQSSGSVNYIAGYFSGFQTTGLVNVITDGFTGVQISGVANLTQGNAGGVQIGTVNIARNLRGAQIGVVNIADTLRGVPVGLLNIARNGQVNPVVFATNISGINAGVKTIANNFHSVIALGTWDLEDNLTNPLSTAWFWGYHFPVDPFYFELDAGGLAIAEINNSEIVTSTRIQYYGVRAGAGWNVTSWLSIFGGVGPGVQITGDDWDSREFKMLYFGGITFF